MLTSVRNADVNLLQVFVAVAESGGISAAQNRLGVAPSTIGTQIAHLETRIGLRLCNRGRSGFSLTPEGDVVLSAAYELLREHDRFSRRIYKLEKEVIGRVRISVVDGLVHDPRFRLADCIARLRQEYPRLQFEIQQSAHKQLEQKVVTGEIDIAITLTPPTLPSLSGHVLFEEEELICCGQRHELFLRAPEDIDDAELEKFDWVTDEYSQPGPTPFSVPPISTASTSTIEGVLYYVLAGTHIAYLPRPYVQHFLDSDQIRSILPEKYGFKIPVSLVSHKSTAHDQKTVLTRKILIEMHNVVENEGSLSDS
ncbi:LysR family transcriptional regulator [Pseudohalocynthiibacter aestuariivivens]|nr:LysR family transcriptional regulator [Pseudohalocynthiibacter aestuariivivens]QIE45814.1 LysR family transcriptional regulator [Pseudohalocynthiibacter aestuariivivens]